MKKYHVKKTAMLFVAFVLLFSNFQLTTATANSNLGNNIYKNNYQIAPGVTLTKENYETSTRRRAINYMEVDLNQSNIGIEIATGNPFNQLTRVTDLARRETIPAQNRYVVGSINASFFLTNGSGLPSNLVVKNNEILRLGRNSATPNDPIHYRYAFGVNRNGKPLIDSYKEDMRVVVNGKQVTLHSFNSPRRNGEVTLYTPSLGHNVPIDSNHSTEIIVEKASQNTSKLSFGDNVSGIVTKVNRGYRDTPLAVPKDGFVIVANGENLSKELSGVKVGDPISFNLNIDEKWRNAQSMIASGPLLVQGGKASLSMNASSSFASSLHPRSAVGITKDNKLIMVTVDGRQAGYSNGISLMDLANYMISLGAVSAINLDGGGSTVMAARVRGYDLPYLVNRPSEGNERRVTNAIQIVSSTPPQAVTQTAMEIEEFSSLRNWESSVLRGTAGISLAAKGWPTGSKQSVKLSYDFSTNKQTGTSAAYLIPKQPLMLEGRPTKIGMWVYGDGRENALRAQIDDRNLQPYYVNLTAENKLNWSGWRYVTADIPPNIPGPFSISRIYIAQSQENKKSMGTIYFNNLDVIYDTNFIAPTKNPLHDPSKGMFPDVSNSHWAVNEISYLANQRVITGFTNGDFQPGGNITREQVALMLVKQLNLNMNNTKKVEYKDVSTSSFYYDAIATVTQHGILTGRSAGYFRPKETLTRGEAAAVLKRAYKLSGEQQLTFSDVKGHWSYSDIATISSHSITTGYPNGTFAPDKPVTRAEFSAFLYRTIQLKK
ncbi:S-layer homology domain-containing protein [Evansella sp. AB-rgal1]|uniref:S-layer homology domain-containing protein n=1 Tax=Evansella sp. AB-rgal1 TaxID=3242696 RepID=UPI00359E4B4A